MALAVATTSPLTTWAAGTVRIVRARLWGLLNALVGKTVANIGHAVVASTAATIGTVLALGGWILANTVMANQTFGTITLRGTISAAFLAVAIHTIQPRGTSGRIPATDFTKSSVRTKRVCGAICINQTFELANANALISFWIWAVINGGTRDVTGAFGVFVGRNGRPLLTGHKTHHNGA